MADNYEVQKQYASRLFLKHDQRTMIRRLALESDSRNIYIRFLGEDYAIDRLTGVVTKKLSGKPASFGAALCIYDYICRESAVPPSAGRKAPINSLMGKGHPGVGDTTMYDRFAAAFDKEPEKFRKACIKLGGTIYPRGDIAFEFEVFKGLNLAVQRWLSDDEFSPKITLLWDEQVLDVLMYETTWYACGVLLDKILMEMG